MLNRDQQIDYECKKFSIRISPRAVCKNGELRNLLMVVWCSRLGRSGDGDACRTSVMSHSNQEQRSDPVATLGSERIDIYLYLYYAGGTSAHYT
jgi:hypothetical protein